MGVRRTQREVLRDVLLCAARYELWMTLEELGRKTFFPQASISAQMRHLRKPENGGFVVQKRRREAEEVGKGGVHERVWEYRMKFGW